MRRLSLVSWRWCWRNRSAQTAASGSSGRSSKTLKAGGSGGGTDVDEDEVRLEGLGSEDFESIDGVVPIARRREDVGAD